MPDESCEEQRTDESYPDETLVSSLTAPLLQPMKDNHMRKDVMDSTRLVSAVEDSRTSASCATIRRSVVAVRCRRVSRGLRWLFRYRCPPAFRDD